MEILVTLAYTAVFLMLIRKMPFFRLEGLPSWVPAAVFLLKICAGVALWTLYTFYYTDRATADIYKYFDDSQVIFGSLRTKPLHYFRMLSGIGNDSPAFDVYYNNMHYWARQANSGIYNDSHTIIRFNAFVRLFSMGYYNVHTVFLCFLSLTGLTAIYKFFSSAAPAMRKEIAAVIFLSPSVLFWGSGVLKEGLIFFALGLLIWHCNLLFRGRSVLAVLLMGAVLALSKFYVWVCILPSLIYLLWMNRSGGQNPFLKYIVVICIVSLAGLNIDKFSSIQNPLVTLSQKQIEFKRLAAGELMDSEFRKIPRAGSIIPLPDLEPTVASLLLNAPRAVANVLCRPLPWEIRSALMLMAGAENLLILFLGAVAILFCRRPRHWPWKYIIFCMSFVVLQFLVIGETTPVVGAIARYRCISLPFLLISFLLIIDKEKIAARWPLYRKLFS